MLSVLLRLPADVAGDCSHLVGRHPILRIARDLCFPVNNVRTSTARLAGAGGVDAAMMTIRIVGIGADEVAGFILTYNQCSTYIFLLDTFSVLSFCCVLQ